MKVSVMKFLRLALLAAGPSLAATVPYSEDFEGTIGSEWSLTTADNSHPASFSRFSGRFTNATQTLSLTGLTPGTAYTVTFDLYVIDSWDGNGGGDFFRVAVDGAERFRATFSNFNGDPPSQTQSYPENPDSGRVHLGFSPSFVDAIYRRIEVGFTATAATAQIGFEGGSLQDISDESWGLDNVSVRPTADLAQTSIAQTDLPAQGSSASIALNRFEIVASRTLTAASANNPANYELLSAGSDAIFGNANDAAVTLVPSYTSGKTVRFTLPDEPLPVGLYRFRTLGLLDLNGAAVATFERQFTIADPVAGKIEVPGSNAPETATVLPMPESPPGGGFFTSLGLGTFSSTSDFDYWRIEAEAGDRLTVRLEADAINTYPQIYLQNGAGQNLLTVGGDYYGLVQIQDYAVTAPGSLMLRVFSNNAAARYRLRVDLARNCQLEVEGNDSRPAATVLRGILNHRIAGSLTSADSEGDFFFAGNLNAGNAIDLNASLPTGSTLTAAGLTLSVFSGAGATPVATATGGTLSHTLAADGPVHVRVQSATNRDLRAQYVLTVNVVDGVPPRITATTLPDEGSGTSSIIDRFRLTFSEDMQPASVQNAAHYSLVEAGPDGTVGTADDIGYLLAPDSYAAGLDATVRIRNGPLQQGTYRLTVTTGLRDRAGNSMAASFVRNFTVNGIAGYVLENRSNGSLADATSLAGAATGPGTGGFAPGPSRSSGNSNPYEIALGRIDGDAFDDAVVTGFNNNTLSVLMGRGDGTFADPQTYPTAANPFGIALADYNGDGFTDVALTAYGSGSVQLRLGSASGTLGDPASYAVGSNPHRIVAREVTGDGVLDLVVGNYGSNSIGVLRGLGDGTFAPQVAHAISGGPLAVEASDLNGDGITDLVSANYGSNNVAVLLGTGGGSMAAPTFFSLGSQRNPYAIVLEDFTGDGKPDLVTSPLGSNDLMFLRGGGDGTFGTATAIPAGMSSNYHVRSADLNGDTFRDLVVACYGNSRVLVFTGKGDGTFNGPTVYSVSGNPIAVALADLTGDGRPDVVTANHGNSTITFLKGLGQEILAENPAGSGLRSAAGRGNLTLDPSGAWDEDVWSFDGAAGHVLSIASESAGNASNSGLRYDVYAPDWSLFTRFYSDGVGRGQSDPLTLPSSGRYTVVVIRNYSYEGEYRFRVSMLPTPWQWETESNDATGNATVLNLREAPGGRQTAQVGGYLAGYDASGDHFRLGTQGEGTTISVNLVQPATSPLVPTLELINPAGAVAATGTASLTHNIGAGGGGLYHVRLRGSPESIGLQSVYLMEVNAADLVPPEITASSLPAAGTTSDAIWDRFTVTFSEDLQPPSVNGSSPYSLTNAGTDGIPGNADDESYIVLCEGYAGGLTATLRILDGPLQPGSYTFAVTAALRDRAGNGLIPFSRAFTITGIAGYILESRGNDSLATATQLSTQPPTGPDGSPVPAISVPSGGSNPYEIAAGLLNDDAFPDAVVTNYNNATIGVILGNGAGGFLPVVTYPTGPNPFGVALRDLNGDGRTDVLITNSGASTLGVRLGRGDGTFDDPLNFPTGTTPYRLTTGDLNGDSIPDAVVANFNGDSVSFLRGLGNGSFAPAVNLAAGDGTAAVAITDINRDGQPDIAAANYYADTISVFLATGPGTFAPQQTYPCGDNCDPYAIVADDFNGDGFADLVTSSIRLGDVRYFAGKADGTFATATVIPTGYPNNYHVISGDWNADGQRDLAVSNYGNSRLLILHGRGDGSFSAPLDYQINGNPIAAVSADFDQDGLDDIATANHGNSTVTVFRGRPRRLLAQDPAGSGLASASARGNLTLRGSWETDFWTFHAEAGDLLSVASESLNNAGGSGLRYDIHRPDGQFIGRFYSDGNGRGQLDPIRLNQTGAYSVRIFPNYGYEGEYRFRVSTAKPPWQWETEGNDSAGSANTLVLSEASGGRQVAQVGGYLAGYDGSGDHFLLGTQGVGTAISVSLTRPAASPIVPTLELLNASSAVVATGTTSLSHTIPDGAAGKYVVRIRATPATLGLQSLYLLSIEATDSLAPTITATSLPTGESTALFNRFTVSFSEDLQPTGVTNLANYTLRSAGPDGVFDSPDDQAYTLFNLGYSSGLSTGFRILDGPLQPGPHQFRIGTGLKDRAGNALAAPFVHEFTIAGDPDFILESRANSSQADATPLTASTSGPGTDGSFSAITTAPTAGANPYNLATALLNADAFPDIVTANWNGGNVSVFLGNGSGQFSEPQLIAVGPNPFAVAIADLNADTFADLAVTVSGSNSLRILLGNGDGTFAAPVSYATGSAPRRLVLADLNGDGKRDAAVTNESSNNVSVLLGNGDGTFATQTTFPVGSAPAGIAVGDLNGDGTPDLAVTNRNSHSLGLLAGNGTGGFAAHVSFPTGGSSGPYEVALADFDRDGDLDAVTASINTADVRYFAGSGTGNFAPAVAIGTIHSGHYHVIAADCDGDSLTDLAIASYNSSRLLIMAGRGDGTFREPLAYSINGNPIAVAATDFNLDGRTDLATVNYNNSTVTILTGNAPHQLAISPPDSGLSQGFARGQLSNLPATGWDHDFWSFSGKAGDIVSIAAETPGNVSGSGLRYDLVRPDGTFVARFYGDGNGRGELTPVILPVSGRYVVQVIQHYDYEGEYRFRVSLLSPPGQWETEGNDSIGNANTLAIRSGGPGRQVATVGGYAASYDGNGDFFRLGTQGEGTVITLALTKPDSSPLDATVAILNATGTEVASGATSATHEITPGTAGQYFARVTSTAASRGLRSVYLLNCEATDSIPPAITATSLPAEAAESPALIDRFSLTFSEELETGPVNTAANYDLRQAGPDGVFDSPDDLTYTLAPDTYSGGLSASFRITNGPLQHGPTRLTVAPALRDRAGNPMSAPFVRRFTIAAVPGFLIENRSNDSAANGTRITLTEAASGLSMAGGRGFLPNLPNIGWDVDFWTFEATAGQLLTITAANLGNPSGSGRRFDLYRPDGSLLSGFYTTENGLAQIAPLTLPTTGLYSLRVSIWYGNEGEYRFSVVTANPPLQMESEDNGGIASSDPLVLSPSGTSQFGSIAGALPSSADVDYFSLGTVAAGQTIYVTTRRPAGSPANPSVSVYSASNSYMLEAGGGKPFDGVAEVRITTTGVYHVAVRNTNVVTGPLDQYLLDVQILPTGALDFPNLLVSNIELPSSTGIQSGQDITVAFTVTNGGTVATAAASWVDRLVLSRNNVLGDADDIPGGLLPRSGALDPGASYRVERSVALPDGVTGNYYVIVETDSGNAVNEFLLEADNVRVSDGTFSVALAPYPDLVAEALSATGPDAAGAFSVAWQSANLGNRLAAAWKQRFSARRAGSPTPSVDEETEVTGPLLPGNTLPHSRTFVPDAAGRFTLTVTTDSADDIYEHNGTSHSAAEANNVSSVVVDATRDLTVASLEILPAGTLVTGSELTLRWTVRNGGNLAIGSTFHDRVMLRNLTTGESFLTQDVAYQPTTAGNGPIAPGDSRARQITTRLPDGLRGAGVIECEVVTDVYGQIAEYLPTEDAETNNARRISRPATVSAYPDLRINGLTLVPSAASPGSLITVNWINRNEGTVATSGNWHDRITVTSNATGQTVADQVVFYNAAPAADGPLAPGAGRARSAQIAIPNGTQGLGLFTFTVTADTYNSVFEYNPGGDAETNNAASLPLTSANADFTAPAISNTQFNGAPIADGSTITGSGRLTAAVTDPSGVSRVEFSVRPDGGTDSLIGTDTNASDGFGAFWNAENAANGTYIFTIRAVDTFGNAGSLSRSVTLALAPPPAPVITQPTNGFATNLAPLSIRGTATPSTQLVVRINGADAAAPVTVADDGQWQVAVVLVNGANQIVARARNAAGFGTPSNTVTATLDLTVPAPPSSLTAVSREDGRIRLNWTAATGAGIAGYHVYRAAASFTDLTAAGVTKLTANLITAQQFDDIPATDGTWFYRVTATSAAGNTSTASPEASATSDRTAPTLVSVEFTPRDPARFIDGRFGTGTVDVAVRVSEALDGVPFFSIAPTTGGFPIPITLRAGASPTEFDGSFTITRDTAAAEYQASFSMRDLNNNRGAGTSAAASLRIDTRGPAADGLELSLDAPIRNDSANPAELTVVLHLDEDAAAPPELTWRLTRLADHLTPTPVTLTMDGNARTWTGNLTLPANAGTPEPEELRFSLVATDDLGNEGREISVTSRFEIYQGDLPTLDAPQGFFAVSRPAGSIALAWNLMPGSSGYQLYRSTANGGPASLQPLTVINDPAVLTYSDTPETDGEYHYAIATLRTANGITAAGMASSPPASANADRIAPPSPLDLSLVLASNGILSQWQAGTPAEAGTRFRVYRAVNPITSTAGLTPLTNTLTLTRYLDPNPSPALRYYAVAAVDASGNESPPSTSAYLNATLWAVNSLTIERPESGPRLISWTNASPDVQGYRLLLGLATDGTPLAPGLLPGTSFTDHNPAAGDRTYTVITVDPANAESPPRSLAMPETELALLPDQTVRRGLVSRILVRVTNRSASLTLSRAIVRINLASQNHQSELFSLAPGESMDVPVVVGGYASLTESSTALAITMESRPEDGALLRYLSSGSVAVADGGLTADVLPGLFTRGGSGQFQFRIRNTSSETVEIISARNSGSADSTDLRVRLIDPAGNFLSVAPVRINVGSSIVTVSDGTSLIRLAPGSAFLSDTLVLPVPETSANALTLQLEADRAFYRYGRPEQVSSPGFTARASASLREVSYLGAITSVTPTVSLGSRPIVIAGRAVSATDQTTPVPDVPLRLGISSAGFERVSEITMDRSGNFSFSFQPLPSEAGQFDVWLTHPEIRTKTIQASFVVAQVTMTPGAAGLRVPRNYRQDFAPQIRTGVGTVATNLRLVAPDLLPQGITLNLDARASLAGSESATLPISFTADSTAPSTGNLQLRLVSDENPSGWATLDLGFTLTAATAAASVSPNVLDTGVNPGGAESETIRLRSTGLVPLKDVQFAIVRIDGASELPPPPWVSLSVPGLIPEVAVGEELPVAFNVQPPADLAQGEYFFDIRFRASNHPDIRIPVRVVITPAGTGDVLFKVVDLLTLTPDPGYSPPGSPNHPDPLYQGVRNATIQLQNEDVTSFVRTVTTDAYGEADFREEGERVLPAGRYKYRVTADGHDSRTGRLVIRPGVTLRETVLIPNRFVSIEWEVVPITIEDRYEILLEAVFETNVPAPVVTVNPPILNLPAMCAGDVFYGEFAFTNHGLIRADSFKFTAPPSDEYNEFELLDAVPASIDARTTIVVPYRVTSRKAFPGIACGSDSAGSPDRRSTPRSGTGSDCFRYSTCMPYEYKHRCPWGEDVTSTGTVCGSYAYGSCGGPGGGPGGGGYWGYGGPGIGGSGGGTWGGWSGTVTSSSDGCFPDFFDCNNRNPIGCWVNYVSRQFEDEAVDLETPVPGSGNVTNRIRRFYRDNRWIFEHSDSSLTILTDGSGPSEMIHLNSTFRPVDSSRFEFSNGRDRIRQTSEGWRLTVTNGNWRDFDPIGRLIRSGRADTTLMSYLYDADGNLANLANPAGTVFATFHWSAGRLTSITDTDGRSVTYEYNGSLLSKVTDSEGEITQYFYDAAGRMNRYIDATGTTHLLAYDANGAALSLLDEEGNGRIFRFDYDRLRREYYFAEKFTSGPLRERWFDSAGNVRLAHINGQLAREVIAEDRREILRYGDGTEVVQEYDENGNLLTTTMQDGSVESFEYDPATRKPRRRIDPAGVITAYQYNGSGQLTELTEALALPEQRRTVFVYNDAGLLTSETTHANDGLGATVRSYAYNTEGRKTSETNEMGKVTSFADHDANGIPTTITDPDGRTRSETHDSFGRLTSRTSALGHRWQFEYDAFNNLTATIDATSQRSETFYNIDNLPSRETDAFGTVTARRQYNPDGRITEQRDAAGRVTRNTYDSFGRIWKVTDPAGDVTEFLYSDSDPEGARPTDIIYPTFRRVLAYDFRNRRVTTTDRNGDTVLRTTIHEIDTRGNVVAITDSEGRREQFAYDGLGRLTRATSGGGLVQTFTYNRFNKVTSYTTPDGKLWSTAYRADGLRSSETSPEGRVRSFTYTESGEPKRTTEPNGDAQLITYDNDGRATDFAWFAAANPATPQKAVTYSYDANGRMTGYSMADSSASFGYDEKGRKTSETVNFGPFSRTRSWTYHPDDRIHTYTDATGSTRTYNYDEAGRLAGISLPGTGEITYSDRTATRIGLVTFPGGLTQHFSHDDLLRPTGMSFRRPDGSEIYSWAESFDGANLPTSRTIAGATTAVAYDTSARLVTSGSTTFTYDDRGNRTSLTGIPGLWTYNQDDEIQSAGPFSFSHDARGNRTGRSGAGSAFSYTWDAAGHLTSLTGPAGTATYRYDPFGRRLSKTIGGTTTYYAYSENGIEAEFDAAGNALVSYGYDPSSEFGQRPLWMKSGANRFWYGFDKLGTPLVLTDSAGNVVWRASYDAFGSATVAVSTVTSNLRLPGQYFDAESGLHYNWHRYYDPTTGTYLSRDPARDDYNHFRYALNDPFTKYDPDGLRAKVSIPLGASGCKLYTSLDFCECGVKCGGALGKEGSKLGKCEASVDLDLCNGRNGGGPGGAPAPKLCGALGCKAGPCSAEVFKGCYDFNSRKFSLSGPTIGCDKKLPGDAEIGAEAPPVWDSDGGGWAF
jgi:RHS repeat-associated protein